MSSVPLVKQNTSATDVGKRLKQARAFAGFYTQKDFASRCNINIETLKSWELGRSPLSKKGAIVISRALHDVRVNCSADWLLSGVGFLSFFHNNTTQDENTALHCLSQETHIHKEIELFKTLNPSHVVILILDDTMSPIYNVGDYVGGLEINTQTTPINLLNYNCIIRTEDNAVLVRHVQPSPDGNGFNLVCLNQKTDIQICASNVNLVSLAPIVWHRKKLITL